MNYPIDTEALAEFAATAEPTRERKCADLARAMGWKWFTDDNPEHDGTRWLSTSSLMAKTIRQYPTVHETEENLPIDWKCLDIPNPFESAADSRALVEWLAADDRLWALFDDALIDSLLEHCEADVEKISRQNDWLTISQQWLRLKMTAPLPAIAEAAWKAIQDNK